MCAACVGVVWCMAVGSGLWKLGVGRGEELGELLELEPGGLMVGGVGWDGLDVLSEWMVMTGSGVVWGVGQRGRPGAGGIVLRVTWKVWVCPRGCAVQEWVEKDN